VSSDTGVSAGWEANERSEVEEWLRFEAIGVRAWIWRGWIEGVGVGGAEMWVDSQKGGSKRMDRATAGSGGRNNPGRQGVGGL